MRWSCLLLATLLLAVGCGSDAEPSQDPGETLTRLVQAAGAGDAEAMWALLSKSSRDVLGPTLDEFRAGPAHELSEGLGSWQVSGSYEVVLSERIDERWAVAAIAGRRVVEGEKEPNAIDATPLALEGGSWKVDLGGPARLTPTSPKPGSTTGHESRIAAAVAAPAAVEEARLWLDGEPIDAEARDSEVSGRGSQRLTRGPHSVVAFVRTADDAAAVAWRFTAAERGALS